MLRAKLFGVFLALCLVLSAKAAGAQPSTDMDALLAGLAAQAQDIKTIQSPFVQRKRLAAFNTVLVTKGRFAFQRPGDLRWEYLEPARSGFVMSGGQGWQWDAQTGQRRAFTLASSPEMEAVASQVVAWTVFDLHWLRSRYAIAVAQAEPLTLRLTPTGQGIRRFLDHMLVQFQPRGRAIQSIELHELDGDWTRITFTDPRINGPLPPDTFAAPK
jgi:outer membrane lipoprotein-sorting protein